jgi:predicted O-methyltransferase YrrM
MSKFTRLDDRLHDYVISVGVREHPVLAALRAETAKMPQGGMQISPDQAAFMQLLARALGVKNYLEIGVFTGYSALALALALPDDGRLTALDASEEWTNIAKRRWAEAGVAGKIDLRLGPAARSLDALIAEGRKGAYDFAFIDADKENYELYFERCLALVRPGGVICADNTLWDGAVVDESDTDADTEAIRAFNRARHADERIDLCLVPIADGLTLARKRG